MSVKSIGVSEFYGQFLPGGGRLLPRGSIRFCPAVIKQEALEPLTGGR